MNAWVVKYILPVARQTYTHRETGINWMNWMDVSTAVSAHVDALLTTEPPLSKADRDLLSAAHYAWRWTCPENPDVAASATLTKNALTTFALTKTLARPSQTYPQNRAEQRSREASRIEAQRLAAAAMRATDSAQKRKREDEASRATRHACRDRILALLEEELLYARAKRLRESHGFDDHRVGISTSDVSDADARAGGFTFAERLDRAEDEDAPKPQASVRPISRAQSTLQFRRKKRTFHHANLASATRSVRRTRHLALPPRLKFVYLLQMSRPSVRRDDRVAHRSPACACSECKRRVPSQRGRLHVEISRNNTCTLHYGAPQVCYLSVVATNNSATSGMQMVYSAKLCTTIVMNNQAVSACPVRFKIFYRRSVEVRHSPLKHLSPSDSYIQCSVIRVHDLRGAARVFFAPQSQTMRVIFRVLHVTLVPRLDHSSILLFKHSPKYSPMSSVVIFQQPSPCEYIV